MPQPSVTPVWSTDALLTDGPEAGLATTTSASLGYQQQGFTPGNMANVKVLNWVLNKICLWLEYVKNLATDSFFLGEDYTWTGIHIWDGESPRATEDIYVYGELKYGNATGTAGTLTVENVT